MVVQDTHWETCGVCGGQRMVDQYGRRCVGNLQTIETTQAVLNPCTCDRAGRGDLDVGVTLL
jgi:hypothetical protein